MGINIYKTDYRLLFFFVILLVAMGAAVEGFMSHSVKMNNLLNLILPSTIVFFLMLYRVPLNNLKKIWFVISILTIEQILIFLKWDFNNILIGRYYDVLVSFIILQVLGIKKFFYYLETAVVFLTKISLAFWGVVVLIPWLHDFLKPYSFPIGFVATCDFTLGFVGLANKDIDTQGIVLRNLGFAWEPGRFSSILVLVLLIHLFRNQFKLFQKNFWTLILGILSTQSSTGYLTLFVCIIGITINRDVNVYSKLMKYIMGLGFVILFVASPLMHEKLDQVFNQDDWMNEKKAMFIMEGKYIPQRIEGLYLEMLNIVDNPLVGYGDDKELSYVCSKLFPYLDISLSNGLLQIIAMLGIPICVLLYIALWKSSSLIADLYNVKGKYLFFLLICMINVSYNFFVEPFVICITLYCVLKSPHDICQYSTQLCPSYQSS